MNGQLFNLKEHSFFHDGFEWKTPFSDVQLLLQIISGMSQSIMILTFCSIKTILKKEEYKNKYKLPRYMRLVKFRVSLARLKSI